LTSGWVVKRKFNTVGQWAVKGGKGGRERPRKDFPEIIVAVLQDNIKRGHANVRILKKGFVSTIKKKKKK